MHHCQAANGRLAYKKCIDKFQDLSFSQQQQKKEKLTYLRKLVVFDFQ
jgi:hypothetical protein